MTPATGDGSRGDVRWLSDAEQASWRAILRGTRLLERALDDALDAPGLQLSEYEIISMLSEAPGRHLRMSALADLVVQSRSRLTHTANRLERRGWVERRPSAGDRRGIDLVLTAEGRRALEGMAPVHVESVRRNLLNHLSADEFHALGSAMRSIADGIRSQAPGHDVGKGTDAI